MKISRTDLRFYAHFFLPVKLINSLNHRVALRWLVLFWEHHMASNFFFMNIFMRAQSHVTFSNEAVAFGEFTNCLQLAIFAKGP